MRASHLAIHLSDISNYSITIEKDDEGKKYKIDFIPLPFRNSPVKGGGSTYLIDSKSFKVLDKEHWM